jgi:hypothetical protein
MNNYNLQIHLQQFANVFFQFFFASPPTIFLLISCNLALQAKMMDSTQNTTNATLRIFNEDFMGNEEATFVQMLSEFSHGLSEVSIFHEKLIRQLQELDNASIERLITSEQAAAKLVENLDRCDEIMHFLGDRCRLMMVF